MDIQTVRTGLIILLIIAFLIIVIKRTRENLRWSLLGEAFGDKGEDLLKDASHLEAAHLEIRVERGIKTSFLFRRFSKELDDRVAVYVLREDREQAEDILATRSRR
ncbi:hypothetical protein ACRPK8_03275 [Exiguobacterium sp. TDN 0502]|uniref:hypothetical protein n=1 Tax=Exiguobacterium sp. TDN 0502 TaxID=3420731 RepID=UPI003D76A926